MKEQDNQEWHRLHGKDRVQRYTRVIYGFSFFIELEPRLLEWNVSVGFPGSLGAKYVGDSFSRIQEAKRFAEQYATQLANKEDNDAKTV